MMEGPTPEVHLRLSCNRGSQTHEPGDDQTRSRSPVPTAAPVSSFHPVTFAVPDRIAKLQLQVSAPATGRDLPDLLFPHGFGASDFIASMRGYGPLVDVHAAHGFGPYPWDTARQALSDDPDPFGKVESR